MTVAMRKMGLQHGYYDNVSDRWIKDVLPAGWEMKYQEKKTWWIANLTNAIKDVTFQAFTVMVGRTSFSIGG